MFVLKKGPSSPLRRLRRVRDLTLDDVYVATGIHISELSRIERGVRPPTTHHREALARFFRVPAEQLFVSEAA